MYCFARHASPQVDENFCHHGIKKEPGERAHSGQLILVERLLAQASWRNFAAVSTDDPAGYGIKDTSSGLECAGDLAEFLFTQKAGARPAQYAVCFLQIRHANAPFQCKVAGGL